MENIIEWPAPQSVEDEAATWLILLDADEELSEQNKAALSQWLRGSPKHAEELKKYNAFWADNSLTELLMPATKLAEQGEAKSQQTHRRHGLKSWQSIGALAAMLVVGLAVVFNAWWGGTGLSATNGHYSTAVGQQTSITLADGSVIKLNTNSQLKVAYHDTHRNIHLIQGEVHFSVAKDATRPFRVYARNSRVQAVGTAFTVYLKESDVKVYVTEGQVALAGLYEPPPPHTPRIPDTVQPSTDNYAQSQIQRLGTLIAGQGATLKTVKSETGSTSKRTLEVIPAVGDNLTQRLAWHDGLLVFSGETLEQMIAEVRRYTTVDIELATPEIRSIEIGGQIRVGDTESMFKALESNFGLQVNRLGYNRVLVTVKAPSTSKD
jgi:transmembrane sensor